MRRPGRTVVLALALTGLVPCALSGCGETVISASPNPTPPNRAVAAARHFLDRYVAPDGRVVRRDQGGDTVGEGQAYGMLIAAAIGDAGRFDAIWGWTQRHLRRPDGLLAFRWSDGRLLDSQAASDADLDASRALLVAACRFHRPALREQAAAMSTAILNGETAVFRGAPVLTAGPWARTPRVIVNPSYFSPASFAALGAATGDPRWHSLATSARSIIATLLTPPSRLPPDWVQVEGDKIVPIGAPGDPRVAATFGFDAARTLVRMAEDPDPAGRRLAALAWPVFARRDPDKLGVVHDLTGRPIGAILHPIALVAAAGAAEAAGNAAAADGLLDTAAALDRRTPTYYGAAWVALGRIMLTTRLLAACT